VNDQLSKIQKENSKYFKRLTHSEDKIHELTQKVVEMDAYQKKLEEKVKYNESEKI
jgi:predicted nuclease with TOPRIM domain